MMRSRAMLAAALLLWLPVAECAPVSLGVIGGVARLAVSDPQGPTRPAEVPDLALAARIGWGRDTRFLLEVGRNTATLSAGPVDVGEHVERTAGRISYQERWRVSYGWKPWLGVGLGYVRENDTLRHTVDSGGFLAAAFPDRSYASVDAVFSADSEWRWTHGWRVGIALRFEAPLDAHATTVVAAGALLTRRLR